MRLLFLIYFFFVIQTSYSQKNLDSNIKTIVENSQNGFQKFRAGLKKMAGTDSVFNSSVLIRGTKDNEIISAGVVTMYLATIIDSASDNYATKETDEWKNKLLSFLGDKWQLKKLEITEWNPAVYGWRLVYDKLTISITQYPQVSNKKFTVKFGIDYFKNDN
jgi:hypothetical protein